MSKKLNFLKCMSSLLISKKKIPMSWYIILNCIHILMMIIQLYKANINYRFIRWITFISLYYIYNFNFVVSIFYVIIPYVQKVGTPPVNVNAKIIKFLQLAVRMRPGGWPYPSGGVKDSAETSGVIALGVSLSLFSLSFLVTRLISLAFSDPLDHLACQHRWILLRTNYSKHHIQKGQNLDTQNDVSVHISWQSHKLYSPPRTNVLWTWFVSSL